MEELMLEIRNDDGVDDAGTILIAGEQDDSVNEVYPATNIKIDRVQFSIFELKRRFDRGTIQLDPDFQRNYVWKSKQKSELIESVIMGIPLPLIYMAETMEGNLVIVDGRQRLTTFFAYLDNVFPISGLRILPELNGYKFSDLEKDEKLRRYAAVIEDFQLVIQIIKYPTPDRVRFDIFDRVNRGGTPLNNQEMRNALYQGNSTRLLTRLAERDEFKRATGYSISSTHMKDRYIILRAITFSMWRRQQLKKKDGGAVKYRSDMEEFLGYSMEQLNRMTKEETEELSELFCHVMNSAYEMLGENVFRIPTDNERRRPVSMTLFESLYFFLLLLTLDDKVYDEEQVSGAVAEMMEDSVFLDALTYNVDSAARVEERFMFVEKKYREMADA